MAKTTTATIERSGGKGLGTSRDQDQNQSSNNDKLAGLKSKTQQLRDFFHDVRAEMRKVTAPTMEQVQSTTIVVLITVFIFAAYFWLVDLIFRFSLDKFIYRFTHH